MVRSPNLETIPSQRESQLGIQIQRAPSPISPIPTTPSPSSLSEFAALFLSTPSPLEKSNLSHLAYTKFRNGNLPIDTSFPPTQPSRPTKPQLVSPKEIPSPKCFRLPLNAYMLHNLAHAELNAINLVWDTVVRFSKHVDVLGEGFFVDFAHVADDESRHFRWCQQRLNELGFGYEDMPDLFGLVFYPTSNYLYILLKESNNKMKLAKWLEL